MPRTTWIFEITADPTSRLQGQLLHFSNGTVVEQLRQSCRQQFGGTSILLAFQLMPLAIADAETLVQVP